MPAADRLTPKQQRFVAEYLIDLNATAAYRRAGYTARTANVAAVEGHRLLSTPKIAEAVRAARDRQQERLEVQADDVLRELMLLAYSDIGDILDFSGDDIRLRPANQIEAKARRCISAVKVRRQTDGRGDDAREVDVIEFKLWSKDSALEKLARHKKLLTDRVELAIEKPGILILGGVDLNAALGTPPPE